MITRNNYEIYFVDYFDGKLDESVKNELLQFVENNPDLKTEFDSYSSILNKPDVKINYSERDRLKKNTITLYNYETWLIRERENDLSALEKKELEEFIRKNPSIKPEREIAKQIIFRPERWIIFPGKGLLKKGGRVIPMNPVLKRIASIAAIIVILISSYFTFKQINTEKVQVAEKEIPASIEEKVYELDVAGKATEQKSKIDSEKKKIASYKSASVNVRHNANTPNLSNKNVNLKKETKYDSAPVQMVFLNAEDESSNPIESNSCQDYPQQSQTNYAEYTPEKKEKVKSSADEIFTKSELAELSELEELQNAAAVNDSRSLWNIAKRELKDVAKAANVSIEKNDYSDENSINYALRIKSGFSVSHTVVR